MKNMNHVVICFCANTSTLHNSFQASLKVARQSYKFMVILHYVDKNTFLIFIQENHNRYYYAYIHPIIQNLQYLYLFH